MSFIKSFIEFFLNKTPKKTPMPKEHWGYPSEEYGLDPKDPYYDVYAYGRSKAPPLGRGGDPYAAEKRRIERENSAKEAELARLRARMETALAEKKHSARSEGTERSYESTTARSYPSSKDDFESPRSIHSPGPDTARSSIVAPEKPRASSTLVETPRSDVSEAELSVLQRKKQMLEEEVARTRAELESVQTGITTARSAMTHTQREAFKASKERDSARHEAATLKRAEETARARVQTARAALGVAQRDTRTARAALSALTLSLQSARTDEEAARRQLGDTTARLAHTTAQLEATERTLGTRTDSLTAAQKELAEEQERLREEKRKLRKTERRAKTVTGRLATTIEEMRIEFMDHHRIPGVQLGVIDGGKDVKPLSRATLTFLAHMAQHLTDEPDEYRLGNGKYRLPGAIAEECRRANIYVDIPGRHIEGFPPPTLRERTMADYHGHAHGHGRRHDVADDRFSTPRAAAARTVPSDASHRPRRSSVIEIPRYRKPMFDRRGSMLHGMTIHQPPQSGHLTARTPRPSWQSARDMEVAPATKGMALKWLGLARVNLSARKEWDRLSAREEAEAEERTVRRSRRESRPPQSDRSFTSLATMDGDSKDTSSTRRAPKGSARSYLVSPRNEGGWETSSTTSDDSEISQHSAFSAEEDGWSPRRSSRTPKSGRKHPVPALDLRRLRSSSSTSVDSLMGVGAGGTSPDTDSPPELDHNQVRIRTKKGEIFTFTREEGGKITTHGKPSTPMADLANTCFKYMDRSDAPPTSRGAMSSERPKMAKAKAIVTLQQRWECKVELPERYTHPTAIVPSGVESFRSPPTTTLLPDTKGSHGFADPPEGKWFVVYDFRGESGGKVPIIKICKDGTYITQDSIRRSDPDRTELYQSMVRTALQYEGAIRSSDKIDFADSCAQELRTMCRDNKMRIILNDHIELTGVTPTHHIPTDPAPRVPMTKLADRPITANPNDFIYVRYRKGNAEGIPEGEVRRFYRSGRVTSEDEQKEYHKAKGAIDSRETRGYIAGIALSYRNNYRHPNPYLREGCQKDAKKLVKWCQEEGVDVLFDDPSIRITGVTPPLSRKPMTAREATRDRPAPSTRPRFDLFDAPVRPPQTARDRQGLPPATPPPKEGRNVTIYNMDPSRTGAKVLRKVILCESGKVYDPESRILSQHAAPVFVMNFVGHTYQAIEDVRADREDTKSIEWIRQQCRTFNMRVDWPKGLAPLAGVAASNETVQAAAGRTRPLTPLSSALAHLVPQKAPLPGPPGPPQGTVRQPSPSARRLDPKQRPVTVYENESLRLYHANGTVTDRQYGKVTSPVKPGVVIEIQQHARNYQDHHHHNPAVHRTATPETLSTAVKRLKALCPGNRVEVCILPTCPEIKGITRPLPAPVSRRASLPSGSAVGIGGPPSEPPPRRAYPPSITVRQLDKIGTQQEYVIFHGNGNVTHRDGSSIPEMSLTPRERQHITTICALAANLSNTHSAIRDDAVSRLPAICNQAGWNFRIVRDGPQIDGITSRPPPMRTPPSPQTARGGHTERSGPPPTSRAIPSPAYPRPKGPPNPPPISVQLLNASEYGGVRRGLYTPGKGMQCGEVVYNFDTRTDEEWTLLHRKVGILRAYCTDSSTTNLGKSLDAHLNEIRQLCREHHCRVYLTHEIKEKLTKEQLEDIIAERSYVAALEIERSPPATARGQDRRPPSARDPHGRPPLHPDSSRPR